MGEHISWCEKVSAVTFVTVMWYQKVCIRSYNFPISSQGFAMQAFKIESKSPTPILPDTISVPYLIDPV